MVGMDAPVKLEEPKERDCLCSDPLRPNGEEAFCSHDCKLKGGLVDGTFNGKKLAALCPITPNPCRENGDSVSLTNSPLSSESPKSPDVDGFTSTESDGVLDNNSPRTPEEGVFDPFAPGPEELLLAPLCKKHVKGSRKIVARRLNFDDDEDDDLDADDFSKAGENAEEVEMLCEKTILDTVYGTLLEAIVEDFLAENQSESLLGTPTSSPPPSFTGIAETCPRAPMKAIAAKSRNIDPGLCRKLEF